MTNYSLPYGLRQYCNARISAIGILRALAIVHPNVYLCSAELRDICIRDGYYDETEYLGALQYLIRTGIIVHKKLSDKVKLLSKEKASLHYWQIKDGYNLAIIEYLKKQMTAHDALKAEASTED